MSTFVTRFLTQAYEDELTRQMHQSVPGMAHWSATGPFGCCCKDCRHYGYTRVIRNKTGDVVRTTMRRKCCGKFFQLTGAHGPAIPPDTEACRHFTPKG